MRPSTSDDRPMSVNYRFYPEKEKARRVARTSAPPLRDQLDELLTVVSRCESIWALEDRIEKSLGRDHGERP
jgi:hypothetical protein